jgi:hypothetical protein
LGFVYITTRNALARGMNSASSASSAAPSSPLEPTPRPDQGGKNELRAQLREVTARAERLELENRRLKQEMESMHIAMELRHTGPPPPLPAGTATVAAAAAAAAATSAVDSPGVHATGTASVPPATLQSARTGKDGDSASGTAASAAAEFAAAAAESLQHDRTKEELNMIKALLLIQNVDVDYIANYQSAEVGEDFKSNVPQVISLSGDARVLNELMGVRKQVRVLKHCCYILRAQVLQLQLAIPQTVDWVLRSAKGAISHQSQRSRQLEIRLAKLRKLLT